MDIIFYFLLISVLFHVNKWRNQEKRKKVKTAKPVWVDDEAEIGVLLQDQQAFRCLRQDMMESLWYQLQSSTLRWLPTQKKLTALVERRKQASASP